MNDHLSIEYCFLLCL